MMRGGFLVLCVTACTFSARLTAVDATCATEVCNAIDDDCDGVADEGFEIGAACDGPDGDACMHGQLACAPDGTDTGVSAVVALAGQATPLEWKPTRRDFRAADSSITSGEGAQHRLRPIRAAPARRESRLRPTARALRV